MAFNPNPPRAEYQASAGQTNFPYLFKIYFTEDMNVYHTPISTNETVKLTEGIDYSVAINGDDGGTVTLILIVENNDYIVLERELDITRYVEYQTSGDLLATTLNADQDYQTYLVSDNRQFMNGALIVAPGVPGFDGQLPYPVPYAHLMWSEDGNSITNAVTGEGSEGMSYVNTISELSNIDLSISTSVNVKGYYAPGDGGGGVFNYISTQSGTNNGGTVINGWVRQYINDIDVRYFGAIPGIGNDAGNADKITNAIAEASSLGIGVVGDGDYYFTGYIFMRQMTCFEVSLVGLTNGARPTKAELKATDEAGRLALFQAYYLSYVTFEDDIEFKAKATFTNTLTYQSSQVIVGGNLNMYNCAWHRSNILTLANASVVTTDLMVTDALYQALSATTGASIEAPDAFLCTCHQGGEAFNGGVLYVPRIECYDTISYGFFIRNNGTIDITDGIVDSCTFAGLINNYGGNFYATNVSIKNSASLAIMIESEGSCFAEGATFDNMTGGVCAVALSGTIQLRDAVFTNTNGYILSVLNEGHIFAEGITVDGTNTGGPDGVYFNTKGSGNIQIDGFDEGLSGLDALSCNPRFNQLGRARAYIGDYALEDNNNTDTDVYISDDQVYTIPFNTDVTAGMCFIATNSSTAGSIIATFRAAPSPYAHSLANYLDRVDVSTDVLTGTTGTDGVITFSAQEGQIQIENRYGTELRFTIRVQQQSDVNLTLPGI